MAPETGSRDQNRTVVALGATDNAALETKMLRVDPITLRLKTTTTISSAVMETGFDTSKSTTVNLATANTQYLLPTTEQADRVTLVLYNKSDTDQFIGDDAVTIATGILLTAGELLRASMRKNEKSIGQNKEKSITKLPNYILLTRNTI